MRQPLLFTALAGAAALLVGSSCIGGGPARAGDGGADAAAAVQPRAGGAVALASGRDAGAAGSDGGPTPLASPERGRELYHRYCGFCHGAEGQGYAADEAPALASNDLLALASDAFLEGAILRGRPGTTMSAWSVSRGGPIGPAEVAALVAHLRTWQTEKPASTDPRTVTGHAARGAPIYAAKCASCHGRQGTGGKYNALANPELLASASDGFLAATIERGRAGTPMPAFAGTLSAQAIDDVVALLRSWQRPPDEELPLPPKPGALRSVVLHPRGQQPAFDPKADFVAVDAVKKELDRGATMIIVDARAPSDYARMHVAGAISVPFYDVDKYAPQLPKDRFVLTYCACPHAASVQARDALRRLGYTRAAVLDEGVLAWRDRGYPVRGGAKP